MNTKWLIYAFRNKIKKVVCLMQYKFKSLKVFHPLLELKVNKIKNKPDLYYCIISIL